LAPHKLNNNGKVTYFNFNFKDQRSLTSRINLQ